MERLTIQYDGEWVPKELCTIDREGEADSCNGCGEQCEAAGEVCGACAIQKCFDRLAEYENTGITPDQIQEIDRLYAEKCRELAECRKELQRV